jgi:hypothetical protein
MTKKEFSMAKETRLVVTCDRHGGVIDEGTEFLHVVVTPGKVKRGRKTQQDLDLCEDCSKAFLKFMAGAALQ